MLKEIETRASIQGNNMVIGTTHFHITHVTPASTSLPEGQCHRQGNLYGHLTGQPECLFLHLGSLHWYNIHHPSMQSVPFTLHRCYLPSRSTGESFNLLPNNTKPCASRYAFLQLSFLNTYTKCSIYRLWLKVIVHINHETNLHTCACTCIYIYMYTVQLR